MKKNNTKKILTILSLILVVSCGGGGGNGNSSSTSNPTPVTPSTVSGEGPSAPSASQKPVMPEPSVKNEQNPNLVKDVQYENNDYNLLEIMEHLFRKCL